MREIIFYKTSSGNSPIEEFLDNLSSKQAQKVTWVLKLLEEFDIIPEKYFKKLISTPDIWEIKVSIGNNAFRFLCFFDSSQIVVLTNAFAKKSQKTPLNEIKLAIQRKNEYFERKD
jgi:phage-related protein